MGIYLAFRHWVDRDLSRGPSPSGSGNSASAATNEGRPGLCYMLVVLPLVADAIVEGFPRDGPSMTGIIVATPFSIVLLAFIGWRQYRVLKARSIKSGRYYERVARYALPPEYRDSEDAGLRRRRMK